MSIERHWVQVTTGWLNGAKGKIHLLAKSLEFSLHFKFNEWARIKLVRAGRGLGLARAHQILLCPQQGSWDPSSPPATDVPAYKFGDRWTAVPLPPPHSKQLDLLPPDLSNRGQFSRDFRDIWPSTSNKVSAGDELVSFATARILILWLHWCRKTEPERP
jgi:hypothetical protein